MSRTMAPSTPPSPDGSISYVEEDMARNRRTIVAIAVSTAFRLYFDLSLGSAFDYCGDLSGCFRKCYCFRDDIDGEIPSLDISELIEGIIGKGDEMMIIGDCRGKTMM